MGGLIQCSCAYCKAQPQIPLPADGSEPTQTTALLPAAFELHSHSGAKKPSEYTYLADYEISLRDLMMEVAAHMGIVRARPTPLAHTPAPLKGPALCCFCGSSVHDQPQLEAVLVQSQLQPPQQLALLSPADASAFAASTPAHLSTPSAQHPMLLPPSADGIVASPFAPLNTLSFAQQPGTPAGHLFPIATAVGESAIITDSPCGSTAPVLAAMGPISLCSLPAAVGVQAPTPRAPLPSSARASTPWLCAAAPRRDATQLQQDTPMPDQTPPTATPSSQLPSTEPSLHLIAVPNQPSQPTTANPDAATSQDAHTTASVISSDTCINTAISIAQDDMTDNKQANGTHTHTTTVAHDVTDIPELSSVAAAIGVPVIDNIDVVSVHGTSSADSVSSAASATDAALAEAVAGMIPWLQRRGCPSDSSYAFPWSISVPRTLHHHHNHSTFQNGACTHNGISNGSSSGGVVFDASRTPPSGAKGSSVAAAASKRIAALQQQAAMRSTLLSCSCGVVCHALCRDKSSGQPPLQPGVAWKCPVCVKVGALDDSLGVLHTMLNCCQHKAYKAGLQFRGFWWSPKSCVVDCHAGSGEFQIVGDLATG